MASLRVKLIGFQNNSEYDLVMNNDEEIKLKFLYLKFMEKGINIQIIKNLKFICNGSTLTNVEHLISKDNEVIVYVFTNDIQIKKELVGKVFTNIPNELIKPNESYTISTKTNLDNLPLEDKIEENYNPSSEEIDNINLEILKCFQDEDFTNILRIYYQKPELIKLANSYLVSGSIIDKINFDEISLEDFTFDEEYKNVIEILKDKIEITFDDSRIEFIKKILVNFKGHLNLSLRYILTSFSCKNASN